MSSDLIGAFLRWALFHSALARGWWLVAAVYLVVVADLSPFQLVLIGVFQGVTVVIAEVPAGVIADAVSRRARTGPLPHRDGRRDGTDRVRHDISDVGHLELSLRTGMGAGERRRRRLDH